MSWLAGVGQRVRELLKPSGLDADLNAELQQHFDHELNRQLASAFRKKKRAGAPGCASDDSTWPARPSPRSEAAASWADAARDLAFRRSLAPQAQSRLHRGGRDLAGARRRGHDSNLQRGPRRPPAPTAISAVPPAPSRSHLVE
jgi:hypothetical protein